MSSVEIIIRTAWGRVEVEREIDDMIVRDLGTLYDLIDQTVVQAKNAYRDEERVR